MQVLDFADQVILQVEDLQVGAELPQRLNLLQILLVQCYLLQRGNHPLIVLRTLQMVVDVVRFCAQYEYCTG